MGRVNTIGYCKKKNMQLAMKIEVENSPLNT